MSPDTHMGPVVSEQQYERVQELIEAGVAEGARVVVGGKGRPDGLAEGYFVQPTVFADVTPEMRIAQEEVFGPVVVIQTYTDEDDAVRIANDSPYGLAGAVSSSDPDRAATIARRLRTGMVHLNGAPIDPGAPFGGYRMSGNGREFAALGLKEFLEVKSVFGYHA